jgi:hypothetical protein
VRLKTPSFSAPSHTTFRNRPEAAALMRHPFLATSCKEAELVPIIEEAKKLKKSKEYK